MTGAKQGGGKIPLVGRAAVLSDVHGNLPALRAVLADIRRAEVDLVVCLGDVVAGPLPVETLRELSAVHEPLLCVRGNADREVVAVRDGEVAPGDVPPDSAWGGQALTPEGRDLLAGWPATARIEHRELGMVVACHATPRSDEEIVTERTPDELLRDAFGDLDARLVVVGNTHMQFDRTVDGLRIVNVGSVGMAYGPPGAYWALLGDLEVELRRTDYDRVAAAEEIRERSTWPEAERFASRYVLMPPSREEALDAFHQHDA